MKNFRAILGGTICVVSFFGLLYCALQHGKICTTFPAFNMATHNTVPYTCRGVTPFVTPWQDALRHKVRPLLGLAMLIGIFIGRSR